MKAAIYKVLETHPVFFIVGFIALVIIVLILLYIVIKRGDQEVTINWKEGIKFTPVAPLETLKNQFDELNAHSELKTHLLKLINQAVMTICKWGEHPEGKEFKEDAKSLYDFILPGLAGLLVSQRDNSLRVAVFTPRENGLKILYGYGYSPEGKKHLELGFYDTKLGHCFINSEAYANGHLSSDPSYKRNPKASKNYESLVCIPMVYQGETIGVLNIDGLKKNSFDSDDIDYIRYFANVLSPLLYKELKYDKMILKKEAILDEKEKYS